MTCFWRFSGQWKYGGTCQSTAGSQKRKRLVGPEECHCKREKETKNQLLRVWEEEKAVPDPKKQKKRVWEIDFHEPDPNRRKTSLHNAKKICYCGSEREKKPCQTRTLLCRQGRPQKYLKNRFVGIFYRWVPEETGIYNRLEKIGRKRNEVTDNGLKK